LAVGEGVVGLEQTGGTFAGSGSLDLTQPGQTRGSVTANLKDLDLKAILATLPPLPVRVEGVVSGKMSADLTTRPGAPVDVSGKLDLGAARLVVQGVPVKRLTGGVEYRERVATYNLEGEALGGRVLLEGKVPVRPAPAPEAQGRLTLE